MPGLPADLPTLLAQAAPAAGPPGNAAPSLLTYLPYALIVGGWFYLMLIRPQQKQEQQRKALMAGLKKNDRVLTTAGIYGTVVGVDLEQDRVTVRVDDDRGVKLTFTKAGIARVLDPAAEKDKEKKEKAAEAS